MTKLLLTTALGGLMLSTALAQSPAPAPATPPADRPAASAPAPEAAAGAPAGMAQPQFVAAQSTDQWVFSRFKGTDVIGPDDKKIGSVSDILFDKEYRIQAIVVGVGGFLGIGEKSVAIAPSAFQVARDPESNDPTQVKLKVTWTREQIEQAPTFAYHRPPAPVAATGRERPATTGIGRDMPSGR